MSLPSLTHWRLLFVVAVIASGVIALMPASGLPSVFDFWDKAQHALAFAALALLGAAARLPTRSLWGGLLLWGAMIEVMQSLTPWRQADLMDWLADAIGTSVALSVAQWLLSRRRADA